MFKSVKRLICFVTNCSIAFCGAVTINYNQTATTTPVLVGQTLPFDIKVETADFSLPNGLQSYVTGVFNGKWLLLAGRTNGLHHFSNGDDNFPPAAQNQVVYVVDPVAQTIYSRSLSDPSSGLTVEQIDTLSVTSAQFYVSNSTLYITGGYGVDSTTGEFSTKDCLTAINIPGLMNWVIDPTTSGSAASYIRQLFNPIFQVTGGDMSQTGNNPTLLVFGQNFTGFYNSSSNGVYTEQVRRFHIIDDGVKLNVKVLSSTPKNPQAAFRRRDLNVVPIIHYERGRYRQRLIAFSGVFTLKGGIWNTPVIIDSKGKCKMKSPFIEESFKQGMSNYICPTIGLFSKSSKDMYTVFLGGLSFEYFDGGSFSTDSEIPFINQITTINYDKDGNFTQYLMNEEYPVIFSTMSNPGNQLLFGAAAQFIPLNGPFLYGNGVLNLDFIKEPTVVGYVVGGIQSTLPNTNAPTDSAASPYLFKVTIIPNN